METVQDTAYEINAESKVDIAVYICLVDQRRGVGVRSDVGIDIIDLLFIDAEIRHMFSFFQNF